MVRDEIGQRLRTVRISLCLKQGEVSQQLMVSTQTLSRYENGFRSPDSLFLQKFCRLFSVNANWLVYGDGQMFLLDAGDRSKYEKELHRLKTYLKKIEEIFAGK